MGYLLKISGKRHWGGKKSKYWAIWRNTAYHTSFLSHHTSQAFETDILTHYKAQCTIHLPRSVMFGHQPHYNGMWLVMAMLKLIHCYERTFCISVRAEAFF